VAFSFSRNGGDEQRSQLTYHEVDSSKESTSAGGGPSGSRGIPATPAETGPANIRNPRSLVGRSDKFRENHRRTSHRAIVSQRAPEAVVPGAAEFPHDR
jgi:hypothetical protein